MSWLPFTPRKIPGTHFCWRLSRTQGHSVAGRIRSTEKSYITKTSCDMLVPVYQTTWSRKTVILILTAVRTQSLIKLSDYVLGLKQGIGLIPGMVRFSLPHSVQTKSGTHPASYARGAGGSFPRQ
jgi:hypothetical protein